MRDLSLLELTLRIAVAAGAAVLLGLEREIRGHPAGVRTHALVAIGAALFTLAGAYGFADVPRGPNVDPARIAAQVASGVGFLGAGAILRQGLGVRGLTTAATLWLAAAIGVTSGAGAYPAVGVGTVVVLIVLVGMRLAKPLLTRLGGGVTVIELDYERGHGTLGPVLRTVNGLQSRLDHLEVTDDGEESADGIRHVCLYVQSRDFAQIQAALDELRARPEVRALRVSGGLSHAT
ncbi:MAG: MgtC/SapB family protein [Frankiaceae bacterium]